MSTPGSDFRAFVGSLAAGAASALAEVEKLRAGGGSSGEEDGAAARPEQQRQQVEAALSVARQLIDTLAMLEKKTEGNLTSEESEALRSSLTSLRISFVRIATPAN